MKLEKILLTTDFSPSARQAYATAASWARETGATVHLIHAAELLAPFFADRGPYQYIDELQLKLEEEARCAELSGVSVEARVLCDNTPHGAIGDYVKKEAIDLIVCSSHGHSGVGYVLLGSFVVRAVRNIRVPLLTCRSTRPVEAPQRILAPMDFSEASKAIMPALQRLATMYGSSITVVHVRRSVPGWMLSMASFKSRYELELANAPVDVRKGFKTMAEGPLRGVDCRLELLDGVSYKQICEFAESDQSDLIAMTTHGWTGRDVLLGNVTERVLRRAPCSILTVPS